MKRHRNIVLLLVCLASVIGCRRVQEGDADRMTGDATDQSHPLPPQPLRNPWVSAEVRQTGPAINNVFVGGKNITRFTNPHHIYTAAVSPSKQYLLVWHMDVTPRQLSIYDLRTSERVGHWEPGAGGQIQWADYDLIHHSYGAGTNTSIFNIYDVNGETVWSGNVSGSAMCESGKYVFILPSLPPDDTPVLITDIRNGDVIGQARPSDFGYTRDHTWIDGQTLRVWYITADSRFDGNGPDIRSIDITIDPDKPQKWATAMTAQGH